MSTRRVTAIALFVALLVGAGLAGAAGSVGDATRGVDRGTDAPVAERRPPGQPPGGETLGLQADPDAVEITVAIRANGSARWRVVYLFALNTENETAAWESLRDDVRTNASTYVERFAARMRSTVADAENATGREMRATDFSVRTGVRSAGQYGAVVYRFRWTDFAATDGNRLRVGDAIEGFYLAGDTTLTVTWPERYRATSVEPPGDARRENAVVWRGGQTEFVASEPAVVLARGGGSAVVEPLVMGAIALVVAVALVGGATVYLRRRGQVAEPTAGESGGADDRAGTDTGAAPDDAGGDGVTTDDEPPAELLSNEERVLKLLRERGGRMKQQEIVEELGWTEAKTSQVVRDLRDDGEIDGFRLGRENVLTLPDVDPLEDGEEDGGEDGDDDGD